MSRLDDLDLTVLTTDRSGVRALREDFEGFTVVRCPAYPQRRDYYIAPGIYKHIVHGNYDIVHCQGIHTAVPFIAMMAAKRRRIPYLVTLHTGGHSSDLRHRLRHIQWRALGPLLRGAAAIVAVSPFEQRVFESACALDPALFRIIPNGGDLSDGAEGAKVIPGLIVSSGRLERYKGHQRAIEALPIVQRSIPDATLRILGSGPYEDRLRSLTKSLGLENSVTIEYIEPHNRTGMAMSLGAAAVVTALSEYEAHPVAVMEALSLGIPTVGLDTAGMADLVDGGLVKGVPKNASATIIAQALVDALECQRVTRPTKLPTWNIAASNLGRLYRDTVRAVPETPWSSEV